MTDQLTALTSSPQFRLYQRAFTSALVVTVAAAVATMALALFVGFDHSALSSIDLSHTHHAMEITGSLTVAGIVVALYMKYKTHALTINRSRSKEEVDDLLVEALALRSPQRKSYATLSND